MLASHIFSFWPCLSSFLAISLAHSFCRLPHGLRQLTRQIRENAEGKSKRRWIWIFKYTSVRCRVLRDTLHTQRRATNGLTYMFILRLRSVYGMTCVLGTWVVCCRYFFPSTQHHFRSSLWHSLCSVCARFFCPAHLKRKRIPMARCEYEEMDVYTYICVPGRSEYRAVHACMFVHFSRQNRFVMLL